MSALTVLFIALATLWILGWQIAVIMRRRGQQISHGFAEDKLLRNRIRVHANAIENLVPFSVLLIALEISQQSGGWLVMITMALMVMGRIAHPLGMLDPKRFHICRVIGMGLSMTSTGLLGLYAVWVAIF